MFQLIRPRRWFTVFGPAQMALVVAMLLLGLFLYAAVQTATQRQQLRVQDRELRTEITELRLQHAELEALSNYLSSDEYIEAFARDRFGLVFPGEIAVVVQAEEPEPEDRQPGERWWQELFID